ncbi:SprT-like domain-containing protein Spartan [Amphibalanus amphitrite]|uniref:SprT-like domain-containing protein Spartan n=1 Tax=Amphibalanus amphitrite TaxID=1232801 RepID=A0A6A4WRJ3_AMPAM|nr:SprT-like domain-containing protein Spartan [Amphibalanus amphitrite]
MIHALLFYKGKLDHIDHGPSFIRWMKRVNSRAGTSITPYHSYHEEVDFLRQHWWRCDGPCTLQAPYFGLVRRAVERAPSEQDRWWARHARQCGGTFHKVRSAVNAGGRQQLWTRRLLKKRVPRIRFKKTLRVYAIPARKRRRTSARKRKQSARRR